MPAKARSTRTKEEVFKRKEDYLEKVIDLLESYPRFLIISCDNIGSKFMQDIRLSLRSSSSILLMGKNTLIRKAIKSRLEEHPEWDQILPFIQKNVGLVLTKGSLADLRQNLLKNVKPASAKIGVIAPEDVILRKQVTALEPSKTSFFAALNIGTKITRGSVEILSDVKLFEKGKKIGSSEATLLQMLDCKPFSIGPKVISCFNNGSMFSPKILDFTETDLFKMMSDGIGFSSAVSVALTYPNLADFPKIGGFRNLVSQTQFNFKQEEGIKKFLDTLPLETDQSPVLCSVPEKEERTYDGLNEIEMISVEDSSSSSEEDLVGFF
jgi:large subunit ribosomal protein LP0